MFQSKTFTEIFHLFHNLFPFFQKGEEQGGIFYFLYKKISVRILFLLFVCLFFFVSNFFAIQIIFNYKVILKTTSVMYVLINTIDIHKNYTCAHFCIIIDYHFFYIMHVCTYAHVFPPFFFSSCVYVICMYIYI